MSFRDLKRQARVALHQAMRVYALYYPTGNPLETPNVVSVRVTYGPRPIGDDGGDYRFATMQETVPKLLFMVAEQSPKVRAVVSISATEVYRIDSTQPIDFISITALCVKELDATAALFKYPGDVDWPISLWS